MHNTASGTDTWVCYSAIWALVLACDEYARLHDMQSRQFAKTRVDGTHVAATLAACISEG